MVNEQMENWVNTLAENDPAFQIGRFDLRAKSRDSLISGDGVKIIELNGCMSEPIHIYDDKHSLWFGVKEFYKVYRSGFTIAASNRPERGRPPYREMINKFNQFFRSKNEVMKRIG